MGSRARQHHRGVAGHSNTCFLKGLERETDPVSGLGEHLTTKKNLA